VGIIEFRIAITLIGGFQLSSGTGDLSSYRHRTIFLSTAVGRDD